MPPKSKFIAVTFLFFYSPYFRVHYTAVIGMYTNTIILYNRAITDCCSNSGSLISSQI